MDDIKIIEKGKQSLNFVEQLQNQIQLCREAISDYQIPLTPRVEALEGLLWAKLKSDTEYSNEKEKIDKIFQKQKENLKIKNPDIYGWQLEERIVPYQRAKAKELFKAIMVFIDKKGFMPIGEENE